MCFDEPIKLVFPCFGKERPLKQSKKTRRYAYVKLSRPCDEILNLNYVNYYSQCQKK